MMDRKTQIESNIWGEKNESVWEKADKTGKIERDDIKNTVNK